MSPPISGAENWRLPCLRRPAPVLRQPRLRDSAALRLSPRLPQWLYAGSVALCFVSACDGAADFRQNIRPSGYAGVVAHRSFASLPSPPVLL